MSPVLTVEALFPGPHQLLPSPGYFALGGIPFVEIGSDYNGDGVEGQLYTNYQMLGDYLDTRYSSAPAKSGAMFHLREQDDWSGIDWPVDAYDVDMLHIVGKQASDKTIVHIYGFTVGSRRDTVKPALFNQALFVPEFGIGDGTVPLLSATRMGLGLDWNYPTADVCVFEGGGSRGKSDDDVEHFNLSGNEDVLRNMLYFLEFGRTLDCGSGDALASAPAQNESASFSIVLAGVSGLSIRDSIGNESVPTVDGGFIGIPDVLASGAGDGAYAIKAPADRSYRIATNSDGGPFFLEVVRVTANVAGESRATKYLDIDLPTGAPFEVTVEHDGFTTMTWDSDGDGLFEAQVTASFVAEGTEALDRQPPSVTAILEDSAVAGDSESVRVLRLNAVDEQTGVHDLVFAFDDGVPQVYVGPVPLPPAATTIYALATDNVGNRGAVRSFRLGGVAGDCDENGFMERREAIGLVTCLAGPGQPVKRGCSCFDTNFDGSIDLLDFAKATLAFNVP